MRKIIAIALLFIAVSAIAQNGPDTTAGPVITAVGKPDGAKTEIKINKDGSSLQSSDGMVALIIPEGAVPKNTVISIQPISNLMANGNGKAYRLQQTLNSSINIQYKTKDIDKASEEYTSKR